VVNTQQRGWRLWFDARCQRLDDAVTEVIEMLHKGEMTGEGYGEAIEGALVARMRWVEALTAYNAFMESHSGDD
jgi:hypothetical protein